MRKLSSYLFLKFLVPIGMTACTAGFGSRSNLDSSSPIANARTTNFPSPLFEIDPNLPASTAALGGAAGLQIDSSSNVLRINLADAARTTVTTTTGAIILARETTGGFA